MKKSHLLILFLMICISCKVSNDQNTKSKCIQYALSNPWHEKNLICVLDSNKISFEAKFSPVITGQDVDYKRFYVDAQLNMDIFNKVYNTLESVVLPQEITKDDIIAIGLYKNGNPDSLVLNSINGYSIYYIEDEKQLFIQNYIRENDTFDIKKPIMDNRISSNFIDAFFKEIDEIHPSKEKTNYFLSNENLVYPLPEGKLTFKIKRFFEYLL